MCLSLSSTEVEATHGGLPVSEVHPILTFPFTHTRPPSSPSTGWLTSLSTTHFLWEAQLRAPAWHPMKPCAAPCHNTTALRCRGLFSWMEPPSGRGLSYLSLCPWHSEEFLAQGGHSIHVFFYKEGNKGVGYKTRKS